MSPPCSSRSGDRQPAVIIAGLYPMPGMTRPARHPDSQLAAKLRRLLFGELFQSGEECESSPHLAYVVDTR